MDELWFEILNKLNSDDLTISYQDLCRWRINDTDLNWEWTKEGPLRTSIWCQECCEAFHDIILVERKVYRDQVGVVWCPDVRTYTIHVEHLRNWTIDINTLLDQLFSDWLRTDRKECIIPDRLWRLGPMTVNGSRWQAWFGRLLDRRSTISQLESVRFSPKTILFVPSALPDTESLQNVTIVPLDLVTGLHHQIQWQDELLSEILTPVQTSRVNSSKPRKRANRSEDIAALAEAMKEHLQSARDYLHNALDQEGVPRLLPRPTQKQLAQQIGISPSRVNRSLKDPRAKELQLLWNLADDLDGMRSLGHRL